MFDLLWSLLQRIQRMMSQDEERAVARAAKHNVDRAFRHVDLPYLLPGWVVDKDLAVSNIHVAIFIDGHTLATAIGERFQIGKRSIGRY